MLKKKFRLKVDHTEGGYLVRYSSFWLLPYWKTLDRWDEHSFDWIPCVFNADEASKLLHHINSLNDVVLYYNTFIHA